MATFSEILKEHRLLVGGVVIGSLVLGISAFVVGKCGPWKNKKCGWFSNK